MGPKTSEVGGGQAVGFGDDFIKFLQQGMMTGSFGGVSAGQQFNASNPMGDTAGVAGSLNEMLAGGTSADAAVTRAMTMAGDRDVGNLRARFDTGGGTAFGTPAAYAESTLRSQNEVNMASTLQQMHMQARMQALQMILPLFAGMAGKGISQRETVVQPSTFSQIAGLAAPIAGAFIGAPRGFPTSQQGGMNVGPSVYSPRPGVAQNGVGGPSYDFGRMPVFPYMM
jgi:hypothetical protein